MSPTGLKRAIVRPLLAAGACAFLVFSPTFAVTPAELSANEVLDKSRDSFAIALVAQYSETYWFYSLCGLLIIGTAATAFRWRFQNMKRRERELIAHSLELQKEISERKQAQIKTDAFSNLGHELSAAASERDAARIIVKMADELLGWDAAIFLLYSEEKKEISRVLHIDMVNNQRADLPLYNEVSEPTPMMLSVIKEGPQLILRDQAAPTKPNEPILFGDEQRRAASLMFVPVRDGKKIIGMLTIQSYAAKAYDADDLKTLEALASHCGGALERISVQHRVQQQLQRETAFANLGYDLSGAAQPEDAAHIISDTALDLFGWDACSLRLFSSKTNQVMPVLNIDTIEGKKIKVPYHSWSSTPMDQRIMKEGAKLILRGTTRLEENLELRAFGDTRRRSVSLMFVPVRNSGKSIGVLSIQSYQPNAYTSADLANLQTLADHCGGALERIAAQEGLREAHSQLEARVEQRTAELSNANELLKQQICERQRAEGALLKSESQLRLIWENSLDGMRLLDENGNFLLVNHAYCKLVEKPHDFLIGKPLAAVYEEKDHHEIMRKYRENFHSRSFSHTLEAEVVLWNGKKMFLELSNSILDVRGEPLRLLSTFRDITDRKRLEEQARQSQKMESIGQLAAGVAHDFNNLLTIINGHTSFLMATEGEGDPETEQSLKEISEAAERAANLTRQLLAFSRKQVMQPKPIDLNEVIGNVAKMLSRLLGEHIDLQFNYSSDLPQIHADTGMIEQIIINMAVNARDAMSKGGQLTISTMAVELTSADLVRSTEARSGNFVCFSIIDTGCGMDATTLNRIFEPFFTTKEVGKGTGLGLATVYGIAKQHQGWVEVESQLGKGSTFKVFFPAVHAVPVKTTDTTQRLKVSGGMETILVVEDEAALRDLTEQILRHYGYRVLSAESGVDALDVWRENHEQIDLLLTDMMMPKGISGRDLSDRLRAEQPKLKVLYTSGYSEELLGENGLETEVYFLPKPYLPATLAQAVRDCLDNRKRNQHFPEVLI